MKKHSEMVAESKKLVGTAVGDLTYDQTAQVKYLQESLINKAKYLKENMERLVRTLETQGVDASVNSCGEVQGLGSSIDQLCVEFQTAKRYLEQLHRIAEKGK